MPPKQPFPPVPLQMIDELEKRFPNRLPDKVLSHVELARLIGEQEVVRFLRREFTKQNNP